MAGKARVHELAKELGVTSKDVLSKLQDLGEYVKSPSSTVEAPVARKLREVMAAPAGEAGAAAAGKPAGGRRRPGVIIRAGFLLLTIGLLAIVPLVPRADAGWYLAIPLIVAGSGLGLLVSQLNNYTLAPISEERVSEAAGVNSAAGSFGLSFGLAFAGAIMLATLALSFTNLAEASPILGPEDTGLGDLVVLFEAHPVEVAPLLGRGGGRGGRAIGRGPGGGHGGHEHLPPGFEGPGDQGRRSRTGIDPQSRPSMTTGTSSSSPSVRTVP